MSRGLSLPSRGSPRDLVLRELLYRERAERVAEVSLVTRLLGAVAGIDAKKLSDALGNYVKQITHETYATTAENKDGLSPDDRARAAKVSALNSGSDGRP